MAAAIVAIEMFVVPFHPLLTFLDPVVTVVKYLSTGGTSAVDIATPTLVMNHSYDGNYD